MMARPLLMGLGFVASIMWGPPAHGETTELAPRWTLTVPARVRIVSGYVSAMDVSIQDPHLDDLVASDTLLTARLRVRPTLHWTPGGYFRHYRLSVDVQMRMTPWGGLTSPALENDPRSEWQADTAALSLDQAFLAAEGKQLSVQVGLIRPHFGLGLVSNGGEDAPARRVRESPFGYARRGDRTARVQIAYFPMGVVTTKAHGPVPPLVLFAAGDMVMDDDSRRFGDSVFQGLMGAMLHTRRLQLRVGLGRRHQEHARGGETDIDLAVLYGMGTLVQRHGWRVWAEGEMAGYSGTSTLSESVLDPRPVEVLSGGGVLRLGVTCPAFEAVVEGGVASGDDSPFDRESHTFSFDRDYRVGLLLFGELARATTAVETLNVSDETYRKTAPRGYQHIATAGAVRNAVYLNPRLVVTPTSEAAVYLGYVYARAEEAVADAFRSGLQGGLPVGPRGARDAQELGHEFDVAVEYELDRILKKVAGQIRIRATLAVLFPGRVFDDAAGEPAKTVYGGWLQGEAQW